MFLTFTLLCYLLVFFFYCYLKDVYIRGKNANLRTCGAELRPGERVNSVVRTIRIQCVSVRIRALQCASVRISLIAALPCSKCCWRCLRCVFSQVWNKSCCESWSGNRWSLVDLGFVGVEFGWSADRDGRVDLIGDSACERSVISTDCITIAYIGWRTHYNNNNNNNNTVVVVD